MKPRHKRMALIGVLLVVVGGAVALILNAFNSNMIFFFSPSDVVAHKSPVDKAFKIGGLVEKGSVQRQSNDLTTHFRVTDTAESVTVAYTGILPDLFAEGEGIVVTGRMSGKDIFMADTVLAKHDEKYMPPEAAEALAQAKTKKEKIAIMKNMANQRGM